jgi:NTP pyrophosphatase (non-canonical NTP hydrolase)
MEHNIFELAKKLAALSPRDGNVALRLIREHGYLPGERTSAIIDLAKALISVWDGNASTLDQASAWCEVWKYLGDAGLVKESSGRSRLGQVLDILGDYRRMSAGAAPLTARCNVSIDGIELTTIEPTESMADASKRAAEEGWPTPRQLDRARMDLVSVRTSMGYFTTESQQDELVHGAVIILANAVEKVIEYLDHFPKITVSDDLLDTSSLMAEVDGYNGILSIIRANKRRAGEGLPSPDKSEPFGESQFHPTGPMEATEGVLVHRFTRDRIKLAERQECVNGWNVITDFGCEFFASAVHYRMEFPNEEAPYDPANAKPCHPSHELYKTGDADAPEQVKDRNGEVVLDQCRHCGRAESQLLDGKPCAVEPANDNSPGSLTDPAAIRRWKDAVDKLATVVEPARLDVVKRLLVLQDTCYGLANNAGWWTDLETGEDVRSWPKKHLDNWVSAKLMLIVTEVAEAMEGHRKGLKDDKLPHRGMLEVELADAVIRIMDLAGGLNMDVAGAIVEKLAYNMSREDHQIENRKAAGGKSV